MPKGVFRMKKLLLVLLVPVLVLGLMVGCGYETGAEMNAYLQGAWESDATDGAGWEFLPYNESGTTADHQLIITPNEMVIRYELFGEAESVPFNVQFRSAHPRYRTVSFGAGSIGDFISFADDEPLTSATDTVGARKIAFINGLVSITSNLPIVDGNGDPTGDTVQRRIRLRDFTDAEKIGAFDSMVAEILAHNAQVIPHAENTLVGGTFIVSDYRSAAELATLSIIVLTGLANNYGAEQWMLVGDIVWSEDVPFYMLSVPLQLGAYTQN